MRIDLENFQAIERDEAFDWAPRKRRRKRKHHNFIKIFIAIVLTILLLALVGYLALKFFIGPIVKTVDGLPSDFPTDLSLYQADRAEINLENQIGKARMIDGLKSMPDWVLTIFLNLLSNDLKKKLADNFGDNINIPNNFSVDDLKKALATVDLNKAETVNLSWTGLDKTKEEIAAYYKQKLQESNFQFKENLSDYQINLGFWKDDVFGIMSFSDKKKDIDGGVKYNSDVNITVNYLNELKK
mgnify:CR=1 FL=1